jgi:hypothetical protein
MKKLYLILSAALIAANFGLVKAPTIATSTDDDALVAPIAPKDGSAPIVPPTGGKTTIVKDAGMQTEPEEDAKSISKDPLSMRWFKQAIEKLAKETDPTFNIFKEMLSDIQKNKFVDYTHESGDDQQDTVTLHKEPESAVTNKLFKLDKKQTKALREQMKFFARKRSHARDDQGKNRGYPGSGDGNISSGGSKSSSLDDDDYDYNDRDRGGNYTPSSSKDEDNKQQQGGSGIQNRKQPFGRRPGYRGGFAPPSHYYGPPRGGPRPIAIGGPTANKIGFAQEPRPQKQKDATPEEIKSIRAKGMTLVAGGTQARQPEAETRIGKRIYPSPQHLDHTRRTKRTSKLVINKEEKRTIKKATVQPEPLRKEQPGILKRTYNKVSGWFSSLWQTIKKPFSSNK